MTNQTLNEATLLAPVFSGTDEEIAAATSSWSSIISGLAYACGPSLGYTGTVQMSDENKRAIYSALQSFLTSKMADLNNASATPTVVPSCAVPTPAPVVPEMPEIEVSYAESQKPVKESISPQLKRMLELARIPHAGNYV